MAESLFDKFYNIDADAQKEARKPLVKNQLERMFAQKLDAIEDRLLNMSTTEDQEFSKLSQGDARVVNLDLLVSSAKTVEVLTKEKAILAALKDKILG
jgi:hypothetical protein